MNNLALLKLRDNLSIFEAGAYLTGVNSVEDKSSFFHILTLVNEGKLNLYLNPNGFSEHRLEPVQYDQEFEGNLNTLRGGQKFINAYLNSGADSFHVKAGSEITGDIFVGEPILGMDDEAIAKAAPLKNKVFTDRVSIITENIYQLDEDEGRFFYIKRKEIDALLAPQKLNEPIRPEPLAKAASEYKYQIQQRLIVEQLTALGYTPTKLPKHQQGKSGVKAEVKKVLDGSEPFKAETSFNEAWKRLRRDKDIKEKD